MMQKNTSSLKMNRAKRNVDALGDLYRSVKEVGIIEPIVIDRRGRVISGKRRLQVAKMLGIKRVPVVEFSGTSIDEQIAELDANLAVLPLGKLEFDQALLLRKQLFEKKYPETQRGKAGGNGVKGFAHVTAKRLGVSKRAIEKGVARVSRASPRVTKARTQGLSPSKVDELIKLPKEKQVGLIDFAKKHSVQELKRLVEGKRGGVSLDRPIKQLQALLDETETLLSQMIAGKIPYELHNGKTLRLCRGTELLLKHFQAIHKERKHLRLVA